MMSVCFICGIESREFDNASDSESNRVSNNYCIVTIKFLSTKISALCMVHDHNNFRVQTNSQW